MPWVKYQCRICNHTFSEFKFMSVLKDLHGRKQYSITEFSSIIETCPKCGALTSKMFLDPRHMMVPEEITMEPLNTYNYEYEQFQESGREDYYESFESGQER